MHVNRFAKNSNLISISAHYAVQYNPWNECVGYEPVDIRHHLCRHLQRRKPVHTYRVCLGRRGDSGRGNQSMHLQYRRSLITPARPLSCLPHKQMPRNLFGANLCQSYPCPWCEGLSLWLHSSTFLDSERASYRYDVPSYHFKLHYAHSSQSGPPSKPLPSLLHNCYFIYKTNVWPLHTKGQNNDMHSPVT